MHLCLNIDYDNKKSRYLAFLQTKSKGYFMESNVFFCSGLILDVLIYTTDEMHHSVT